MKHIYKFFILLLITIGFISCDKNENFEILSSQKSFEILTPSDGSVIVLDDTNLSNNALFISWFSPNNIDTYTVEVALTGTDFEAPVTLGTSQTMNFGMTVGELNDFLLDVMELNPEEPLSLDIRVSNGSEITKSIAVVITPFKVEYSELYLVGSLTNWSPEEAIAFTNTGLNEFELTVSLADDDAFKFIPTNTSWDGAWKEDPNNPGHLITEEGDPNISGYPAGNYKIYVNLNTFTFTITEILVTPPNNLYLLGDATAAGWDPNNNNYPMFKDPDQEGVFIYTGYFAAGSVKMIEKLETDGWQPQWGKGAGDGELAGNPATQDSDPGTIDISANGYYTFQVDFKTLSYTLEPYDATGATVYNTMGVIGAATPTGWGSHTAMTQSTFDPHIWYLTLDLIQNDGGDCDCGFKFRVDDTWNPAWGGIENPPTLNYGIASTDGKNIGVPETGTYRIFFNTLDFRYSYELVPEEAYVPENLYLVGDATAAGWDPNNNNYPMYKDVDLPGVFSYTGYFAAGSVKMIEKLETDGWQPQWGKGANDGELAGNPITQAGDPDVISVSSAGYYKLQVNFNTLSYTFESYDASGATVYNTMGVIGAATPTGWDSDTAMTQSTFDDHIWYLTLDMTQSDGGDCDCGFKFRVDDTWDPAWGGIENPPTLNYGIASTDGKNIGVPETGTYRIFFNTLDFTYYYVIE